MKSWSVTIQMKATEQHFPVVLFIMLYKVVLAFECEDTKTQMLVLNKEGYWISIPFGTVLYPSVLYIIPSQRGQ